MTAAQKALDALEAANAERTQGVWFAVDVTGRKEPNDGIWIGGTSAWAVYSNAKNRARHSRDAKATALSVNLAAPLAAVVRAAMEYRDADAAIHAPRKHNPRVELWTLQADRGIARNKLFAALDAFNAAALAQGFQ